MGTEDREPRLLLDDVVHRPVDAWQPHGEVVTEAVDGVVGAGHDPLERQFSPLWLLGCDQTTHKADVGVYLVGVHPRL